MESTSNASKTVAKFNHSKANIERNIEYLSKKNARDQKILESRKAQSALGSKIKQLSTKIEALTSDATKERMEFEADIKAELRSKKQEILNLKKEYPINDVEDELRILHERLRDESSTLNSLTKSLKGALLDCESKSSELDMLKTRQRRLENSFKSLDLIFKLK